MSNVATPADAAYFCRTFADVMNFKAHHCRGREFGLEKGNGYSSRTKNVAFLIADCEKWEEGEECAPRKKLDEMCQKAVSLLKNVSSNDENASAEIIKTSDGIVYFDPSPAMPFGIMDSNGQRFFHDPNDSSSPMFTDTSGIFDGAYKIFCIDIDGIPDNTTDNDCINECPFGYGIRSDGRIYLGYRAREWLEKDIQDKE